MKKIFFVSFTCIVLFILIPIPSTSIKINQLTPVVVPIDGNEIHYRVISGSGNISGLGKVETDDTFMMIMGSKTELFSPLEHDWVELKIKLQRTDRYTGAGIGNPTDFLAPYFSEDISREKTNPNLVSTPSFVWYKSQSKRQVLGEIHELFTEYKFNGGEYHSSLGYLTKLNATQTSDPSLGNLFIEQYHFSPQLVNLSDRSDQSTNLQWGNYFLSHDKYPIELMGEVMINDFDSLASNISEEYGFLSNIWNTTDYTNVTSAVAGGPGLFVRSYVDHDNYDLIWWDTVLSSNKTANYEIHVINATEVLLDPQNPKVTTLVIGGNADDRRSLHPEFTFDGQFVYVSVWELNGSIAVIDAFTLEIVTYITGLTTPTGIFNAGLRVMEAGL